MTWTCGDSMGTTVCRGSALPEVLGVTWVTVGAGPVVTGAPDMPIAICDPGWICERAIRWLP
jgi:hypothetical protein